jgi:predicted DNA-binding protein (MmcQ/YjbR family)
MAGEDSRLKRLAEICTALPDTSREDSGGHATFRVGKKVFAYFLNNHHGDGIVAVSCKVMAGDNQALAAAQPDRFYLPAYTAHRGWVALRLDQRETDWEEVSELVRGSYRLAVSKRR